MPAVYLLLALLVEWKRASHVHVYTLVLHTLLLLVALILSLGAVIRVVMVVC